jgi:hypothetical protein
MQGDRDYRDRRVILAAIGAALLLVGVVAAVYSPAEIYSFAFFSPGGRFHYEGFGLGSLMFAIIVWQIVAYAAIAFVLIPLGYGHLRLRRWARPWMVSLLWCAWILGVPLLVVSVFLLSFKELSAPAAWLVLAILGLSYLIGPGLLIRFYDSRDVRQTFAARDGRTYRIETVPMPVLVLAALFVFYVVAMQVPLFFHGLFPLFGRWLSGAPGAVLLESSVIVLLVLTWGVWRRRAWAWWGALAYFVLLTCSVAVTLLRSRFAEIVTGAQLPPAEVEMLQGVPLQGVHLVPFVGIPLLITLGVIIVSRRHFQS